MSDLDLWHMSRAIELARQGEGLVEPNPMVGCVIAHDNEVIGEGWHTRYGAAHAEIEALRVAGKRAPGATLYVTLEPCSHFGKTSPCSQAVIAAGIRRVVCAQQDPFPQVQGHGLSELTAAGIQVEVGLLASDAAALNAPYLKLVRQQRPWVIAKWAMTLDGRIATHTGDSRWISSEASRAIAHQLRGRVDAILVGSGTAAADNPQLTARPAGMRTALRVVIDSHAILATDSHLAQTARKVPVLVAVGTESTEADRQRLSELRCEVLVLSGTNHAARLGQLLDELGKRRCTNVLVEGGSQLLGLLFDQQLVDECHVFIAPKIIGGSGAVAPIGGQGIASMAESLQLIDPIWRQCEADMYIQGRISR